MENYQRDYSSFNREKPVAAFIFGLAAAIIMAYLWKAVTVALNLQIGYMAIAVGFAVGYTIRFFGKGTSAIFGIMGALLSLFSCILGNFLSNMAFLAAELGISFMDAIKTLSSMSFIIELMQITFHPMDILFYGIAIYTGYKYAFAPTSEENADQDEIKKMEQELENRE